MASDDNRGKSGSRFTQAAKLNQGPVEKGMRGGSGAALKEPPTENGSAGTRVATSGAPPSTPPGTPSGAERPRTPSHKPDLADQIGARLRSVYDDVLVQPVPDRFLELLRQLESAPAGPFARAKKDGA